MIHIPVLKKEVIKHLDPKPNQNFVDCTVGTGGHALAILALTEPNGKLLGIDWDKKMIDGLRFRAQEMKMEKMEKRLILVHDSFAKLQEITEKNNFQDISGILLDLGMSSWHIEQSGRGFSFQKEEKLDMRYNPDSGESGLTAQVIVNQYSLEEIEKILREYGEERLAKRIAQAIVEKRKYNPIKTTVHLINIIKGAVPGWYQRKRIHYATKTFQALRIAVNNELDNVQTVLPQTVNVLKSKGKILVISFHSLEDRIIKNFFKEQKKKGSLEIVNKKVIKPSPEEIKVNPRARSAKLRVAIKY